MPRAPRTILPRESLPYAAYQHLERLAAELAEHGNEGTYQIGPAVYVHLTRTHASIMMALPPRAPRALYQDLIHVKPRTIYGEHEFRINIPDWSNAVARIFGKLSVLRTQRHLPETRPKTLNWYYYLGDLLLTRHQELFPSIQFPHNTPEALLQQVRQMLSTFQIPGPFREWIKATRTYKLFQKAGYEQIQCSRTLTIQQVADLDDNEFADLIARLTAHKGKARSTITRESLQQAQDQGWSLDLLDSLETLHPEEVSNSSSS
jgi:hypothetical protein